MQPEMDWHTGDNWVHWSTCGPGYR